MSSKATHWQDHTEYSFCDMENDTYQEGEDELCPACGRHLDGYSDLNFIGGIIQVCYSCECGKTLTFNYYLKNVIVE